MKNEKFSLTVHIDDLSMAQALALDAMFQCWEQLGSMGCSRWVAFMADGDGDFRPKVQVVYNPKPKWFELELISKAKMCDDLTPNGKRPITKIAFDYDAIGWALNKQREERDAEIKKAQDISDCGSCESEQLKGE